MSQRGDQGRRRSRGESSSYHERVRMGDGGAIGGGELVVESAAESVEGRSDLRMWMRGQELIEVGRVAILEA